MPEKPNKSNIPPDTGKLIDIPDIFHSSAAGKPFEKCMVCDRDLISTLRPYIIEKAIKNYPTLATTDTIFEYAMCEKCYTEALNMYSQESRQRIENYYENHVDMQARIKLIQEQSEFDLGVWLDRCLVKNKPREICSEYQIFCECIGPKVVLSFSPMMICDEAAADLIKLLSDKTKDDMGRFKEKYFDLPPELKINPKQPEILLF